MWKVGKSTFSKRFRLKNTVCETLVLKQTFKRGWRLRFTAYCSHTDTNSTLTMSLTTFTRNRAVTARQSSRCHPTLGWLGSFYFTRRLTNGEWGDELRHPVLNLKLRRHPRYARAPGRGCQRGPVPTTTPGSCHPVTSNAHTQFTRRPFSGRTAELSLTCVSKGDQGKRLYDIAHLRTSWGRCH